MTYKNGKKQSQSSQEWSKRKQLCSELYQECFVPNDKFKFETNFLKIQELLNQIINEEKNFKSCIQIKRTSQEFDLFKHFLNDNNCKINDLLYITKSIHNDDDFTVRSNRQFKKGDLIFDVPGDIILTVDTVRDTFLGKLFHEDKMLSSMPNVALALAVLFVKLNCETDKKLSKWSSYMNILPNEFHTPLYFSLDEIKLLKASQSFYDILYHIRNISRLYAYLFNLLDSKIEAKEFLKFFTYENFRWAVSVVSTRQNQIYDSNKKPMLAMIPLLDMCNHEDGEFCTDFNNETLSALCYAHKDINPGDEITIFYGSRSNFEMLIHNGFVCECNKRDKIKLKLGLTTQDILFVKRSCVLEKFGLKSTEYFELSQDSNSNDQILPSLFVFVKIFTSKSDDELNEIFNNEATSISSYFNDKKLGLDSNIIQFLTLRFSILIKSIELQQKNAQTTTNSIFIKHLLNSEKSILQTFLNYLNSLAI
ncbi:unnamed protein product [Brachionus calyciflorus]|uniref:protein-histidine N-methyltransferase n=1 Tax=Brachionus calyciflorus TaxID=104777 RepID=A0A813RJ47_9BILA|nr:unnamed protein product [Brachionus calyciflorus]